MNNRNIAADGFGTSVTQMHMFHAVDRLGIAQYLSRIGLMFDDGDVLMQNAHSVAECTFSDIMNI